MTVPITVIEAARTLDSLEYRVIMREHAAKRRVARGMRHRGVSYRAIGEWLGVNFSTISKWCHSGFVPKSYPGQIPFWHRTEWCLVRPELGPCLEWRGAHHPAGYGQFKEGGRKGRQVRAHVRAYELFYGPVPSDGMVCHRCDNPRCCNPNHLYAGTQTENAGDASRRGRWRPLRGEASPNHKLTDAQVREARELRARGWFYKDIARKLGAESSYICRICNGKARV